MALYRAWGGNADEGWTRWVLEQHEFPFAPVHDADLREGRRRERFDVIVLPDATYDAMLKGVQAWIPAADPSDTFLGMDRSDDPVMKGGWRGTWQGTIEETALKLCADMGQYFNDSASGLWLSRQNWFRLERELEAKNAKVIDQRATEYFGVPALALLTPAGTVPVLADPFCPSTDMFLLDHDSWEIHHMEGLPHVVTDDGLTALRLGDTDDDGIAIRFRAWMEGLCFRPFTNGRAPIES